MRERLQSRASRSVAGEPKGDSIQLPHRAEIERATGFDFRNVRAYADREGLDQIGANAASHGNKVWFGDRHPSLQTVAHELAHVRQVGELAMSSSVQQIGAPDSALEHEADAFASAVARGAGVPDIGGRSDGSTMHLDPKKKTITKIDVNFKKSDGKGNGVGKVDVVVHYDDKTTKTMSGDGGGKTDKKGIHPTSGGKHHVNGPGKDADHHSSVYNGPDGKPAPMKFYTPFAPGEGFHKGNPDDMSHGCIHLNEGDAKEIFDHAPDGVEVHVNVPKAPAKKAPPKKPPANKTPAKKDPPKKPPAKKKKGE
ncbi:MAG TPA: DUF4157 domain-containing protein [Kofleriaceae bacterium]|nr:DUF4157 domain-containing protein [Kofleriaceae bacterium]